MNKSIREHLVSAFPETNNAKEFFHAVRQRYQVFDKFEASNLMSDLASRKYNNSGGVREYILEMVNIQSRLKNLEISLPDSYMVHTSLDSPLDKEVICYFSKKLGHKRRECANFQAWLEMKKLEGNSLALVCFESNLVNVSINSWCLDNGANVHVVI
ncbi:hypothetical protein CDL12_14804 [Handroanthus impetiginosus]|uniref:Uncharacterized protein n=1 Tax=Handroanthus impetiginosus TaxID=429701 RepID=A0A2G9H517_9LAMI|nr:hypothetical protein CDL12_14804 [Handroanthus impetiginosus]